MKLCKQRILFSIVLLGLTSSVFATPITRFAAPASGKVYLGIFGGEGSPKQFNADQYGTAFFSEAVGGPLAVNAFGHVDSDSAWFIGAQLGYQAPGALFGPCSDWSLVPAIELEGYEFGKRSVTGELLNNTTRLPEHDFDVRYSMKRNIFLTNIILTLDKPCLIFHPYIGLGIGSALVRLTGASSIQTDPPEVGINHYNANTRDMDPTFAGQVKLGLSYDISNCVSVFAEYRFLYLGSTHFTFGSTAYPTHAETSSWQVKFDPQRYNLGSVGVRFSF